MSSEKDDKSPDSTPTMPSTPTPQVDSSTYRVARTPVPRGVRRISGSLVLRYEEALRKLEEPARKLDEVRATAREAVGSEEEQKRVYDADITGQWNIEEEMRKAQQKKE